MTREQKIQKFLMGLCLNAGESMEDIAKHLGVSSNSAEIKEIMHYLEQEGFIKNTRVEYKSTKTSLTKKGDRQASSLLEVSN
ncbi:hypothetical protein [Flammeovirga sp. OC4]|uniref:hypothetical protein n=1 Tax=Flammeovirga sp. OC4 TaxID=1382345 RepID=UPI0005C5DCBB|nr:hypothetical protein [Flammeovirga sp. OC4]